MIGELMGAPGALCLFLVSLVIFGFAPGMVLALIVRMIPDPDRRRELQAELYEVPRWEQPYWVAQQFEVALRVGALPQLSWLWGRHIWHRAKIESGLECHRRWPESFWIPDDGAKSALRPGDHVKLLWSVKRMPGERMWVTITERHGDRLVGTLSNLAVCAFLRPDEVVKFRVDDIIDCILEEDACPDLVDGRVDDPTDSYSGLGARAVSS